MLIALAGSGAVAAVLWFAGIGPFAAESEDPFMVRIPINVRPIPAYAKVQREDLLNPATRGLMFQKIPPAATVGMSVIGISTDNTPVEGRVDEVKDDGGVVFIVGGKEVPQSQVSALGGALMNVNAIIGRVVKADKRAGLGFRESTFFPKGTPEGVAGATPPGMRALTLDATKLTGIHSLNAGNRLDLLASIPLTGAPQKKPSALLLTNQRPSAGLTATEPVLLARSALLLKPVYLRNETTTTSSLTSGKRQVNEPKYEVTIAVDPEDVIPLQDALDKELRITCVAASMQPGGDEAKPDVDSTSQLMAPVTVRSIPAYAVVTREAFISPATRHVKMVPVTQRQIDELGLTLSLDEMLGAVARHDIPAGSFVRQSDLLKSQRGGTPGTGSSTTAFGSDVNVAPQNRWLTTALPLPQQDEGGGNIVGDRPAVTSFIPPGRTAVAVPWNRIFGSEHLQIDDHLDLLASYPLERKRRVNESDVRGSVNVVSKEYDEYVSRGTDRTRNESLGERGEPWFVATDAIVIGPVGFPPPNAAMRATANVTQQAAENDSVRMTGPAILLAVDSRDLESLATVLNTPEVLLSVAFRARDQMRAAPQGFRRIAVAPVAIPAYSEFSDLHWKGLRRDITSRLVSDDDPRFAEAIEWEQIGSYYGRILKSGKARFAAFSDADFMPEGARPGVAGAVGPNHVVLTVVADQIQAINQFSNDDEVALLLSGNFDVPSGVTVHSSALANRGSRVVIQSARIVRAASDISDTVALEVRADEVAALTTALFAHDATGASGKHDQRLVAVARHRSDSQAVSASRDAEPVADHRPLKAATRVYEVTGGKARTHLFLPDSED